MAYLKADGFETYGDLETNMELAQWADINGSAALTAGAGRDGGYALQIGSGATLAVRMTFGKNTTTCIIAFAIKFVASLPASSTACGFSLLDNAGTENASVTWGSDGSILFRRGSRSGTILAQTAPDVLSVGSWLFFEIKATASQTVGAVEIRVNGVTEASATGLDSVNGSNVEYSQINFNNGASGTANYQIDDFFILDDTGPYLNDFLGDRVVLEQVCDADGADADWTLSAGVDSYAVIDEIPQDGDTTYAQASIVGDRMGITFPDLPAGYNAVECVELFQISKKTSAGTGSVKMIASSNSVEGDGPDEALTEAYAGYRAIFETDPDTTLPWSVARANAVTAILERTL